MGIVESFLITAAASALDPLFAFALLWPAVLHRRWWPLAVWALARAALTPLLWPGSDALKAAGMFAGALAYMTVIWFIAEAIRGRRPAKAE